MKLSGIDVGLDAVSLLSCINVMTKIYYKVFVGGTGNSPHNSEVIIRDSLIQIFMITESSSCKRILNHTASTIWMTMDLQSAILRLHRILLIAKDFRQSLDSRNRSRQWNVFAWMEVLTEIRIRK
jgi:hypothetical protein